MYDDKSRRRPELAILSDLSTPLGQALARALVRRGVTVAGLMQQPAPDDLGPVLALVADVRDPIATAGAIATIRERLGAPTILINNAEQCVYRDVLEETPDTFMDTLRLNLGGAFNCCHAVLPDMVAQGFGRIINVVTFADIHPAPLAAGYSVSKGALRILTKSLLSDLGDRFPGIVITDWIPGTHDPRAGIPDGIDPALAGEWGASLALMSDPRISGLVFLRDREHRPPGSLRRKMRDRLIGRRRQMVRLD